MTIWCVQACFVLLWWIILCQNSWFMRWKCDNKEGDLSWEHPFPRVSGYKRGSYIKEADILEIRVYFCDVAMTQILYFNACYYLDLHIVITI